MITQKILILGITGNLAKIKILPAVGQYFMMHKNQINIELYGYSRSVANLDEIKTIIQKESNSTEINLPKITLATGQYEDNNFYHNLVHNLQPNESLLVYLAVPPSTYLPFLQNSCPYSNQSIDIVIEKPFGESPKEAEKILQVVSACDLHQKIHFLDHYLFKSATQVKLYQLGKNLNLSFKNLKKITVQALETVDAKDRGGYYDTTGAIKDMFPHLYSLFNLSLQIFDKDKTTLNWMVNSKKTLQYREYTKDINNENSETETYFETSLQAYFDTHNIEVIFESGKKQSQKLTQITMEFEDNKSLVYTIAPQMEFKLYDQGILKREIPVLDNHKLDHTTVFEDVLEANFGRFVSTNKVLDYWQLYEKIKLFEPTL